jgi:hypothetical protein
MPTANRDASLTTARRRQLALFGWRTNGSTGVKNEQAATNGKLGVGPTGDVTVAVHLGAQLAGRSGVCECSPAISLQGYDKHPPACAGC